MRKETVSTIFKLSLSLLLFSVAMFLWVEWNSPEGIALGLSIGINTLVCLLAFVRIRRNRHGR